MRLAIHKLSRPAGGYGTPTNARVASLASDRIIQRLCPRRERAGLREPPAARQAPYGPAEMSSGPQNMPGSVLGTPDQLARTWPEPEAPSLTSHPLPACGRPVCAGQTANCGGGRESNPPTDSRRRTGFEDPRGSCWSVRVRAASCCLVPSGGTFLVQLVRVRVAPSGYVWPENWPEIRSTSGLVQIPRAMRVTERPFSDLLSASQGGHRAA